MELFTLDRDRLVAHIDDVLAIEHAARRELGSSYSHERWSREEFLHERPGKWRLSTGASLDGRLVGFAIASLDGANAHVHRVGVHPAVRRRGIARRLVAGVEEAVGRVGLSRIQLSVGEGNRAALAFWLRMGYRPLTAGEHRAYAERRGLECTDAAVSVAGFMYRILEKELK